MSNSNQARTTSNRGFAAMDPEQQRRIASEGGKAAHASGNAHEFTSKEAAEAGRKGGQSRGANNQRRLAAMQANQEQAANINQNQNQADIGQNQVKQSQAS